MLPTRNIPPCLDALVEEGLTCARSLVAHNTPQPHKMTNLKDWSEFISKAEQLYKKSPQHVCKIHL